VYIFPRQNDTSDWRRRNRTGSCAKLCEDGGKSENLNLCYPVTKKLKNFRENYFFSILDFQISDCAFFAETPKFQKLEKIQLRGKHNLTSNCLMDSKANDIFIPTKIITQ
jgi:hypothetical protein